MPNPILLIKYAVSSCSAEQVTTVMNQLFGEPVVERVIVLSKTNYTTGSKFFMFFIHLKTVNAALQQFITQFEESRVQKIMYNDPWYWNVVIAEARQPLPPRILPNNGNPI